MGVMCCDALCSTFNGCLSLGVWNLTLFKAHLSTLPLEHSVFQGFHDPEDPSIVSVDAHIPSGTGA